ncbi:Protein NRT1/ PTR FAMILY 8.1 [Linum grandiflorum]
MGEEDNLYTKDGTTDFHGNLAVKEKTGTWKACPYILGNECCERLAYYGINTNLVNYLKFQMNQRNVVAVNNVTNWSGTCYVMPLLGAFLADAYLGRYWTIAAFSIIYVFGMTLLTMSASLHALKPTCNDSTNVCHPTASQTSVFFLGLYLIALGTGGIKPCVSSFGADQFDDSDEEEKKKKGSFFNWFYFSINIGALVASSVLVWVQTNVGWDWGFGIPAAAMAVAVVSFFSGTRLYRHQVPGGSPVTRICQVVVASLRKLRIEVPADKGLLFETSGDSESAVKGSRKLDHTDQLSHQFLGQGGSGDPIRPNQRLPKPMATLHRNPSRRTQINRPPPPNLGHRNNLLRRLQPNGNPIRPPRQHNGPPHHQILPDPICFPLPLRHRQRHPLGPNLRPRHRPSRPELLHRPPKRLHPAPTDRNRTRHLDLRDAGRRNSGDG